MTETMFTPGPWIVHGGLLGHKGDILIPTEKSVRDCHHIARCFAPKPRKSPIDDLQVLVAERDAIRVIEANAHLIAAAPELYEALEGLLADIEEYQQINKLGGENNHWQVISRVVLAKARGETHPSGGDRHGE